MKEITKHSGKRSIGLPRIIWFILLFLFCMLENGPRGMFWTKMAQNGPPGTPRKRTLFQERGRKRMKEWGEVTFMKEWVKALDKTRILAPTHLQNLVSFPRYGCLKKSPGTKFSQIVNISFCSLSFRRAISLDTFNGP